jgi:hypothetical protein
MMQRIAIFGRYSAVLQGREYTFEHLVEFLGRELASSFDRTERW